MAAKPLSIHPAALEEFKSALLWYLERSENAARNFADELDRAIAAVRKSPARWPTGAHGTRSFVMQRFPFAVVYRETKSAVQVVAIAHGHRRPGYRKNRIEI